MEKTEQRLERAHRLIKVLQEKREELITVAVRDTGFTYRECNMEVDTVLNRLHGFDEMADIFRARQSLTKDDEEVALVLPYNGSAWLNVAIVSIYLVGNRVRAKFASRDSEIARFTDLSKDPSCLA